MRAHTLLALLAFGGAGISNASVSAAPSVRTQPAVPATAPALRLTLDRLVEPASRIDVRGQPLQFSLHALIPFDTVEDLFTFIDGEAGRWQFDSPDARQSFAEDLLRRGVESRVVSMTSELPLEIVLTHTRQELLDAVGRVRTPHAPLIFKGRHWQLTRDVYQQAFLRVRDRWSRSLNCWSASSTIAGRVLSNWYVIDEGIELFGSRYDSTEHFWQAVKYHPDVTVGELRTLLTQLRGVDWQPWLAALASNQEFYFANAYAVEFLKKNLARDRLAWFDTELARVAGASERARAAQQRQERAPGSPPRFTSLDEKVLWGDLADVFHLIVAFADRGPSTGRAAVAGVREALVTRRFDAVYADGYRSGRVGFLSRDFQGLMLEIWKVKFLKMPRFAEVIRSTAGARLDHFLDDGDSPDIPIPIYVGYLNRIREMAMEAQP